MVDIPRRFLLNPNWDAHCFVRLLAFHIQNHNTRLRRLAQINIIGENAAGLDDDGRRCSQFDNRPCSKIKGCPILNIDSFSNIIGEVLPGHVPCAAENNSAAHCHRIHALSL